MTVQIIYAIIIKSLIRSISAIKYGRFPEWPKGTDCKSVVYDFGGSNPPPSTKCKNVPKTVRSFVLSIDIILNCYGYCAILILIEVLTEPLKTSKNTRKKGKFKGTETAPPRAGITPVPREVSLYFSIASASLRISCSPYWYRSRYSMVCSSRPATSCTVSTAFCTALQICKSTF